MTNETITKEELLKEIKTANRRIAGMEETLRMSLSVFNSLHSMLISVNCDGNVTRWNAAVEKLTGKPFSSNNLHKIKAWDILPFLRSYREHLHGVILSGTSIELRRQTIDLQEKKYADISIYPLMLDNEVKGAVIEIEDKTELIKKDLQLLQAQKMETVGNLAGGLAHDFNNVLGGITGAVSLIQYMLTKEKNECYEKLKKDIHIIEISAQRATGMVKQLLALSKKNEPSFQAVDLNLSLRNIERICKTTFDKSVELCFQFYPEKAMIEADPIQVEQMLLNLCVNAAHAMTFMRSDDPSRGGLLKVSLRKSFQEPNKTYWLLEVSDTGIGMSPQIMSKIFDPFFTTKKKDKGTGLGLTMVYNIVKQHGAFMDIYSEPGNGSTFNIFFPMKESNTEHPEPAAKEEAIPIGKGLILLADDETLMRETASAMLQKCGYEVISVENGKEAVRVFKEINDQITLVLLDLAMPKMGGREAFLKMKKIAPDVKVLLASGSNMDDRVEELIAMGVKGFIPKPYSLQQLAALLHRIVYIPESAVCFSPGKGHIRQTRNAIA